MRKYSRKTLVMILLFIIPIGIVSKFYSGPASFWMNNYAAGVFYDIFWCLVAAFFWRHASSFKIVVWVFIFTRGGATTERA